MTKVAIDFGTTNTVISIFNPETQTPQTVNIPQIAREITGINIIPSLVFVENPESIVVGEKVRQQFLRETQSARLFQAFKKDLIAEYRSPPRQIDGLTYTPELVCELFLLKLWNNLLTQNIQPDQVILTLPTAGFNSYLSWFEQFINRLNIPVVKIIDEATAAALGYSVNNPESLVLAIDFGGGTLDLSLVHTPKESPEKVLQGKTIATASAYIGGVDIDNWIAENYLQQMGLSSIYLKQSNWQNLLQVAEALKIQLSQTTAASATWIETAENIKEIHLTRTELERILAVNQLLPQVQQAIDEVLQIALTKGISKNQIEQVLLVGGSCMIPAVQQLIISYFGADKVKFEQPLTAVAYGALTLGKVGKRATNLKHSYALRLWQPATQTYSYFRLFNPGTSYPCRRQKPITLQAAYNGQQRLKIDLGELIEITKGEVTYDAQSGRMSSEVEQTSHFRPLEHPHPVYLIPLEPPGEINQDRIQVTFAINEQGTVVATVTDILRRRILVNKGVILETAPSITPTANNLPPDAAVFGSEQEIYSEVVELPYQKEDLVKNSLNFDLLYILRGHSGAIKAIAFSPTGEIMASGSEDQTIKLWNLHTKTYPLTLQLHKKAITCLAFSPDKPLLATGSEDTSVILWHWKTGEALKTFTDHHEQIFSLTFSCDGQTLASGGWDNYINLRQVYQQSLPTRLPANSGGLAQIAFSLDGQTLVSCGDKTVNVWNYKTPRLLHTKIIHLDLVTNIAISPDGQTLATSGGMQDQTIKLWHLSSGELLNTFSLKSLTSTLTFSPGGDLLVSANGKNINFWEVETGKLHHTILAQGANIICLAFSPDGEKLVSGSADGIIKVWGIRSTT
ncbi:MAG: Hsp70 family protein [Gomphosphaeria aponina SAG 52.96 = DSM 107014]|uniref:Hsp70 family protein n=1 Tax=Gomphosphaeria aponina SAG 52.96 = DSM 107014 TaxID=1521640 RepID=A0A941JUM0_9CHRO|nr:Hsp70 family protein [Gomphosphaeria aponina SAG 52.96 = DSM 107014]